MKSNNARKSQMLFNPVSMQLRDTSPSDQDNSESESDSGESEGDSGDSELTYFSLFEVNL